MSMGKEKNKIAFSGFGTSCNGLLVGLLSSHPQLFPDLDQFLNGTSTGDAIIHHATSGIRSVIGLTCSGNAQAGQITAKQLEVISAHDVVVAGGLRAISRRRAMTGKAYHIRYLFASAPTGRHMQESRRAIVFGQNQSKMSS